MRKLLSRLLVASLATLVVYFVYPDQTPDVPEKPVPTQQTQTRNSRTIATLECTVRSVHDGDSLRVQCPGELQTIAVRMRQIDAPELDQDHGTRARDHLRKLCPIGTKVLIHTEGHDQYDRLLGDLQCQGKNVNEEMVSSGSAWVYNRHVEDRDLYQLQDEAREQKRGLWAGHEPVKPWTWRYEQRNAD